MSFRPNGETALNMNLFAWLKEAPACAGVTMRFAISFSVSPDLIRGLARWLFLNCLQGPGYLLRNFRDDRVLDGDELIIAVSPVWVFASNQFILPCPAPPLQLLFVGDGGIWIGKISKPDKTADVIFLGVPAKNAMSVLPDTARQIAGHADIDRAIFL